MLIKRIVINMKLLLAAIYIIFTTLGLFLMKMGGNSLSFSFSNEIGFKIGYITLLGFLSYICSFLLWQKLLVTYDLTYIVPITTGIVQIIVLLIGILFFKEHLNIYGICGALFIIFGIVLMAIGKK